MKLATDSALRANAGFTPRLLRSVTGWWRADRQITIATNVSTWRDLTKNGRNWAQATGSKQPVYSAATGPNSRPCIASDGVDDTLSTAFTLTLPWTIYLVWKWNAAFAAADEMIDSATAGNIHAARSAATTLNVFATTGAMVTPTNWHYYSIANTAGTSVVKQDGSQILTGGINGISQPGLVLFTFGDGTSNPANASVAEIILIDGAAISAADDARIVNYIKGRYAL